MPTLPAGAAGEEFLATLPRVFAGNSNQAAVPVRPVAAARPGLPRRAAAQAGAAVKWTTRIGDAARRGDSPDAVTLYLALAPYLSDLPHGDMALMIDVLLAIYGNHTAKAKALKSSADTCLAQGRQAPALLRAFVAHGATTGTDYARQRRQGGTAWRFADRNLALVREAYDWRLEHPIHDWREGHQDLAEPAELLEWTVHDLAVSLDRIEGDFGGWRARPGKRDPVFYPSAALCRTYGLPHGNPQDELLYRHFPPAFRGLLIAHVAGLAIAEWERRFTEALENT